MLKDALLGICINLYILIIDGTHIIFVKASGGLAGAPAEDFCVFVLLISNVNRLKSRIIRSFYRYLHWNIRWCKNRSQKSITKNGRRPFQKNIERYGVKIIAKIFKLYRAYTHLGYTNKFTFLTDYMK